MKRLTTFMMCSILLISMSCTWPEDEYPYESSFEAITMSREEFEKSTALIDNQPIEKSGKIYIKDHFLIINEPRKGFHIYDNSDPKKPVKLKFLKVLGSTDLSIKGNTIFANNAVDLISITTNENFSTIEVTKRIRNIFPELIAPDGFFNTDTNIVLDWK